METKDNATERFLTEGLFMYAEAQATVGSYESAAVEKVKTVARRDTGRLLRAGGKAKVEGSGICNSLDASGRVAYAKFAGQCGGENVQWEIGIWWEFPWNGKRVSVYAECSEGPDHLTEEQWAQVPKGSPAKKWKPYAGGLNLQLDPDDDVDTAFRHLLDEIAEQSTAKWGR
jgi:hypothetical protein